MPQIAIIGSGPAGFYTAEAARRRWPDAGVDLIDALPVPYGLIRSGVAPDHQSIKAVARRYEAVAEAGVRFLGNIRVGEDVSVAELAELYDAVVLATGAPHDRPLGVPGEALANVFGSAAFVGWYNGHPQFAALAPDLASEHAVVIGNGNVALDVARILAKTPAEFAGSDIAAHALSALAGSRIRRITILGRRGPQQIAMTPKELGELAELARGGARVDAADLPPTGSDAALEPGLRKAMALLRGFAEPRAAKPIEIAFDFFAAPRALIGDSQVAAIEVERTRLEGDRALPTGETYRMPAALVVACIGYRTPPIAGVPYDTAAGRFPNRDGWIAAGLYCVGWARRGPSGTIGTNRPDGYALVDRIAADIGDGAGKPGGAGLDALAAERGLRVVSFADWQRIEAAEAANARAGAPREKFTDTAAMLRMLDG